MEDYDEQLGPIDYLVVEFAQHEATGEPFAELMALVEGGLIRILDLVFIRKEDDGSVSLLDWHEAAHGVAEIEVFEGASARLLAEEDLAEVGSAMVPGAAASVLVYENLWSIPFARAARRAGGELIARGPISTGDVVAALQEG